MSLHRIAFLGCGLYLFAWTLVVANGKAIHVDTKGVTSSTEENLLPPLIFPTDRQKNNIAPINKTAIKILLHDDDLLYNISSASQTKADDKETKLPLTSTEVDDLQKTEQKIAVQEGSRAKYAKLHPQEAVESISKDQTESDKDQVENFQETQSESKAELEEQYNRQLVNNNYMSVAIVNVAESGPTVRDHLAWISMAVLAVMGLSVYAVMLLWRAKLEQRYGNRQRLYTEEDTL